MELELVGLEGREQWKFHKWERCGGRSAGGDVTDLYPCMEN